MTGRIFLVLLCALFLYSCGEDTNTGAVPEPDTSPEISAETGYRKISAEEARAIMESADNFILLDVRTEEDFRAQRIDGAILIPDYEIADRAESELPDKDALILIYCRSGRRSGNVARELIDMGYTNVYDFGGLLDWFYETVSD